MKNFKKSIAWMLTLVMVISCMVVPAYAEDNPDARTAITTAEELMAISADMTGNYYLANDIELTGTFTPIGLGEQDDVPFTGVFDGETLTITFDSPCGWSNWNGKVCVLKLSGNQLTVTAWSYTSSNANDDDFKGTKLTCSDFPG